MTTRRALVLGGGGLAGIAWMTGLLHGLAETGNDITGADLVIGTSAGSTVAAQLTSGLPLASLYARQTDPALQSAEIAPEIDFAVFADEMRRFTDGADTPEEMLRAAGAFALAARTVPEGRRREVIAGRLPAREWPAAWTLRITAIDCADGSLRVFDSSSGVPLVDAVAASCAVPGVWPPVTIGGRRYMDGGARSSDNADLASGAERIVVVSPLGTNSEMPSPMPLRDVVSRLEADGSQVTVISPDSASTAAFGANPLDPASRGPSAEAGYEQGRAGL
ncbi:MAG: patatin-like phospholipase family protein [Streptosporangiales bacterium]|nr:patatin-like phospholipase family protein [Streptosporangiales bacterium]